MPLRTVFCVVAVAGFLSVVAGTFTVESSYARVIFPSQESKRPPFVLAMADFGEAKYGGTLMGQLVYPLSRDYRCAPEECRFGCSFFNTSRPPFAISKAKGQSVVMLLDRGPKDSHTEEPCYFLNKVYYAQLAGADAVIIVNDIPGADLATAIPPDEEMYLKLLPVIKISAGVVSSDDGDYLKKLLASNPSVTLQLSWRNILPKRNQVVWELWTNSNDECKTSCDEQKNFIKAMRPYAKKLELSNQTQFTPHYLIWSCPKEYLDSAECQSECVGGGTYCAPDPDGDLHQGYSGLDVLEINLAQLCFFRVAQAVGAAWLWWQYVDTFGDTCKMADQKFNRKCAGTAAADSLSSVVFASDALAARLQSWHECIDKNLGDKLTGVGRDGVKEMFEQELAAQYGQGDEAAVSILPTVRVNGHQYRGTLDAPGVMRAICAAFITGQEPSVCNENWVSDDECQPGAIGYTMCNAAAVVSQGRTRCINTFTGWSCECGEGWLRVTDPVTQMDSCADVNECQVPEIMTRQPSCSCDRCACINTPGSFNCSGPLPNLCTEANNWNGCWAAKISGEQHTACKDNLEQYRRDGSAGTLALGGQYTQCVCPPCFAPGPNNYGCVAACDLKTCDRRGGCGAGSGTYGVVGIFFTVFGAVLVSCVVIAGAYQLYLRRTMHDEVREIMATYMPLDDLEKPPSRGGQPRFETATSPPPAAPAGRGTEI